MLETLKKIFFLQKENLFFFAIKILLIFLYINTLIYFFKIKVKLTVKISYFIEKYSLL